MATQRLLSFFTSLFTVFVNKTNCIWSWVLLLFRKVLGKNAFFSVSLFFIYQCRKENVPGCLGEFGLTWRNPQCDCLPKAHLSLESSSFSLLLPPRRQQQGWLLPLSWLLLPRATLAALVVNAGVKRMYGFSFRFTIRV